VPVRARIAFSGAAAGIAALFAVWFAAFHVGVVERADVTILLGFVDLHQRATINRIATFVANLCDPNPYVYFAMLPVLVALARGRPRVALAVAVLIVDANLTTQVLKPLLASPRTAASLPIAPASWPSGHATAAMSLALSALIAAPSRLRPHVAALGAGFAVAVSYSFLTLDWHYPSDVFGGYLVAATWGLLVVGALFWADARWPRAAPRGPARGGAVSVRSALGPPAAWLLGAGALAALIALARPHAVVTYARAHETFIAGAGAIAALGLVLATGLMLALRR
jgi:membrane-associated phospholipid phosphatase